MTRLYVPAPPTIPIRSDTMKHTQIIKAIAETELQRYISEGVSYFLKLLKVDKEVKQKTNESRSSWNTSNKSIVQMLTNFQPPDDAVFILEDRVKIDGTYHVKQKGNDELMFRTIFQQDEKILSIRCAR